MSAPLIHRDDTTLRAELRRDIAAVALDARGRLDLDAILTRPTLLRRVAALLAAGVPATTDRLVASAPDAPLAAAVALHCGVAFALIGPDGTVRGELHPSDQLVAVATTDTPGPPTRAGDIDVRVLRHLTVVGGTEALFRESALTQPSPTLGKDSGDGRS